MRRRPAHRSAFETTEVSGACDGRTRTHTMIARIRKREPDGDDQVRRPQRELHRDERRARAQDVPRLLKGRDHEPQ